MKEEMSVSGLARKVIGILAGVLLILVLARFFLVKFGVIYIASGSSMKSTIEDEDVLLINEMAYTFSTPKRFDLVLIKKDNGYEGVKRIVGLPDENIGISGGKLLINGKELEQKYWNQVYAPRIGEVSVTLAEKEYFVLGDNLAASEDSRSEVIGPVKESEIMGIPWFCIYPFTDMGIVR